MARQCVPGFYSAAQNVVINITLHIFFDVFLGACLGVICMWYLASSLRNRLMHIVYGNMGQGRKGKGKGAGKGEAKGKGKAGSDVRSDAVAPSATSSVLTPSASTVYDVSADVRSVLPQAAILRAQSQLVQDEWSVPVFSHQTLSSRGGVSAVPVDHIAEVIQRVGFTSNPVAILVTRDPDSVGLRGYPRQKVRCGLSVMGSEGIRIHTEVDRFMVQLGFGEPVHQNMRGVEVALLTTMVKMVIKLPERHGWPSGPHPASVIISELSAYVPEAAVSDIVPREGPSASFLLHSDFVDVLLKNSGKRGTFFKSGEGVDMELLWLPEGYDLVRAIKLATHDTCFGVVEKGGAFHPRYAIRFRTLEALRSFAKTNNIEDFSAFGRWKLSGIHASTGLHGVAALLQQLKWLDVQILYLTEGHAVFLASNRGWDDPAFFRLHGTSRQLLFKALNSQARGMARDGNARSSGVEEPKTPVRSLSSLRKNQLDFLAKVFPEGEPTKGGKGADPEKRQAMPRGDGRRNHAQLVSRCIHSCMMGAFSLDVNIYMRMVNGNTRLLRLCYLNPDGVMGKTRGPAISALPADVIAISETHLTADLLKLVDGSFPRFRSLWGPASQAGVGFLVRDAAVWAVRPIQWPANSPCHRHFTAGRLHGISLYLGNGKKQLLCYVIYGYSGARWSSHLKKRTHNIMEAVLSDAASRGLPAIFGGDLNLGVSDSDLLQRLPQLGWSRLADAVGLGQAPTCFKGGGSVIDHIYCNQLAMASFISFYHGDRTHFADHNPLFGHFNVGVASQVVYRNRSYGAHPVDGAYVPLSGRVVSIHHMFDLCLQRGDVDSALRYWNQYAEKHFASIVAVVNDNGSFQRGRGTVRVDPQPLWPPSRCGDVASLAICRLWKQCCRMVQLQKQTFGELARRTWKNAARCLSDLSEDEMAEARQLLLGRCQLESVVRLRSIFETAIVRVQREQKHARIASWKAKLQSSVRAQHTWLRNDGIVDGFCFQGADGHRTANVAEQFEAVREAWRAVNELFKDGEPDHAEFFRQYNGYIAPHEVALPELSADMLRQDILSAKVSSPGLDGWSYPDLKILAQYAPWVYDELCSLLRTVERIGKWPSALISGFTTLIPKSADPVCSPTDLRPITVLSSIYRVWARIRARQLGKHWQDGWAHDGMFGGRQGRGCEPLLFQVALDLEGASDDTLVGGLSFDLAKAFDRVPRELLGRILRKMALPCCVLQPYLAMLRTASRRYKLGVCLDQAQPVYGGILQGCPLSMIALNAIINIWLKALNAEVPGCKPRAYADDVSVTTFSHRSGELIEQTNSVFQVSATFVGAIGGLINLPKSFSFGNQCLDGNISNLAHSTSFRLIGGSIAIRDGNTHVATSLELKRQSKWAATVRRARHLPVSWSDRCGALLRTRTQFTYGTGTHCLSETTTHLRSLETLRSDVMRCLLRRQRYVASPGVYFSLVASPSLNPYFSRVMDGLLTAWRAMKFAGNRAQVKELFYNGDTSNDGPVARLRQVDSMSGFRGAVASMLEISDDGFGAWLHDTREAWRHDQWRKVARDRSVFQGIEKGILKDVTLCYLRQLEQQGWSGPFDSGTVVHEQARMKASVLRLLLTGGLFTRDLVSQHKTKQATACDCSIGGPADVFHISWKCAHYASLRAPINHLSRRIRRSKSCFRFATIVCEDDADLATDVVLIQQTLVNIWQASIKTYLYGDLGPGAREPAEVTSQPAAAPTGENAILENGHYIIAMMGGGVWCRKCGTFVREPKHRRLKISYRQCPQKDLDRVYWLSTPSFQNNPHRALDLYKTILDVANGHDLAWNASIARASPHGELRCLRCARVFRWDNRHNVKRQPCQGAKKRRDSTPPRWVSPRMYREAFPTALQCVINAGDASNRDASQQADTSVETALDAVSSATDPAVAGSRVLPRPSVTVGGQCRGSGGKGHTYHASSSSSHTIAPVSHLSQHHEQLPFSENAADIDIFSVFDDMG